VGTLLIEIFDLYDVFLYILFIVISYRIFEESKGGEGNLIAAQSPKLYMMPVVESVAA
jgi:hypothetical protein